MRAWVDADIVLHRAASFCEDEFDGLPAADWRQGVRMFEDFLTRWLSGVKVDDYRLVFTKGHNFRKDFYPDYKANRKLLTHWPGLWETKNQMMDLLVSEYEDGIEADDIIGIRCSEDPENTIAISADKDFQTVPLTLFIPPSHGRTKGIWIKSTEDQANLYWFRQAILGDTVDNYFGIKGYGPVNAAKVLPHEMPLGSLWEATRTAFLDKGYDERYALNMVRLARILRHGDYDWGQKKVKLWTP